MRSPTKNQYLHTYYEKAEGNEVLTCDEDDVPCNIGEGEGFCRFILGVK